MIKKCKDGWWRGECPTCHESYEKPYVPALSRRDNKTYICSDCGVVEALEDFSKQQKRGGVK